jgi:FixJ family two-component response regulator
MTEQVTVHVVDDDELLRGSLASLFRSVGYLVVQYASAADFLQAPIDDGPSCLVLDVRLPGISGLELQDTLRREAWSIPVVFMTGYADVRMSVRGMKAGAADFLEKPFRDQDMLDAIASALQANRTSQVNGVQIQTLLARYKTLTPRELEVFHFVVNGRLNKEIAAELGIREITVKVHRAGVMRKMEVRSVAELSRVATLLDRVDRG